MFCFCLLAFAILFHKTVFYHLYNRLWLIDFTITLLLRNQQTEAASFSGSKTTSFVFGPQTYFITCRRDSEPAPPRVQQWGSCMWSTTRIITGQLVVVTQSADGQGWTMTATQTPLSRFSPRQRSAFSCYVALKCIVEAGVKFRQPGLRSARMELKEYYFKDRTVPGRTEALMKA